jgi:hypothetical protein
MVRSRIDPTINYPEVKALDLTDTKETQYKAPLYEAEVLGIHTIVSIGQIKNIFIEKGIVYFPLYLIKDDKVLSQIGVIEAMQETIPSLLDEENDISLEKAEPALLYSFVKESLIRKAIYVAGRAETEGMGVATAQAPKIKSKLSLASLSLSASEKERKDALKKSAVLSKELGVSGVANEDEDFTAGVDAEEADLQRAIRASILEGSKVPDLPLKHASIPVQTLDQFEAERKRYRHVKDESWMESYYENNNFKVIQNSGGGDCFFIIICQAYKTIDPDTTMSVIKLRRLLSYALTERQFTEYKTLYDEYSREEKRLVKENQDIATRNKEIKERFQNSQSKQEKLELKAESEKLIERNKRVMQEIEVVKENKKEVKFMKGVKTIQQLREVMQKGEMTSEYWVDAWAIAALEVILNIKFINLSYNDYNQNQRKTFQEINVINCGNDLTAGLVEEIRKNVAEVSRAEGAGSGAGLGPRLGVGAAAASADMGGKKLPEDYEFNPDYYIMVSHSMEHYELITYYGNAMLTFPEIPYSVKLQIVTRCLQGKFFNGAYSHIPQFKLFIQELGIAKKVEGRMVDESVDALSAAASNPHFSENIQLVHHKSAGDEMPGRAQGDYVTQSDKSGFMELGGGGHDHRGNNNWRRKISNEWNAPFTLDGHRWLSVEHYYQANKFFKKHPEFYLLFTMDANKKSKYYEPSSVLSRIAHDVELATYAGRKLGTTKIDGKKVVLRPEEVVIDPDFFNGRHAKVLEDATYAKFTQNDDLANILLLTNNAKLINYHHTKEPSVSVHLMRVRSKLRTKRGGVNDYEME